MGRHVTFTKAQIARALGGVLEAGVSQDRILGVHIGRDGCIEIQFGEPKRTDAAPENEWDEVLGEKP